MHLRNQVAVHHSAMRHRVNSHYIAVQNASNMRRQMAALQFLVDREMIVLDPRVMRSINLNASTSTVLISASQQRHIIERRQISSQKDADICANRLTEALSDIRYFQKEQKISYYWEVIGFTKSANKYVRVVIKLVPESRSRSGKDELWISTACLAGDKKLKKWLLNKTFVVIDVG